MNWKRASWNSRRLQKKKGQLSDKQDTYIETERKEAGRKIKLLKRKEIEKLLKEMDENAGTWHLKSIHFCG